MSSIKKIVILGVLLTLIIILCVISCFVPKIEINLKGLKYQTVLVGDTYKEEGAIAYLKSFVDKKEISYEIDGNVNTQKTGKYVISYKANNNELHNEQIRIVNVIDKEPPRINVKQEITGCKNNNLVELNVEAVDNYDGNVTDKLEYKILKNNVIIKVEDSSNNKAVLKEKIKFIDSEKPVITLKGSEVVYLNIGEEYVEEGANAYDSCDGNISENIVINGNVNAKIPGIYQISYKSTDSLENTTELIRSVIVQDENNPYKIVNDSTIYLTFDDGPGKYTSDILDVLNKYNIKATFFVTNQFPKYINLLKDINSSDHSIGIHTHSHEWSIYESVDTYLEDFNKIDNIIYEATGVHSKIFRFPGGSSNRVSKNYNKGIMSELSKLMTEKGYIYFDWDIDSGDTSKKDNSKEAILKNIKKSLGENKEYIILMHDIRKNTLEALPEIIEYARACGYKFDKITETTNAPHFKIAN